ncbi:hypothetical protein QBC43DRAFT_57298 [Cladorrhinum sp. PSN259]|nr:hypothetical protein QBC43DRAFT_57298 [Cladorrhinum sp. PSN259]
MRWRHKNGRTSHRSLHHPFFVLEERTPAFFWFESELQDLCICIIIIYKKGAAWQRSEKRKKKEHDYFYFFHVLHICTFCVLYFSLFSGRAGVYIWRELCDFIYYLVGRLFLFFFFLVQCVSLMSFLLFLKRLDTSRRDEDLLDEDRNKDQRI